MEEKWGYEDWEYTDEDEYSEYKDDLGNYGVEVKDRPCAVIMRAEISKLLTRGAITLFGFDLIRVQPPRLCAERLVFHANGSAEWNEQDFGVNRNGNEWLEETSRKISASDEL